MKKFLLLIILAIQGTYLLSQTSEDTLKEYFQDAEFFLTQEEYVDALYDYMELYNNGYKDNANVNYRIGICYLNITGQKDKSIQYLLAAVKNTKNNNRDSKFREEKSPMDAWLYLGMAYRINTMPDEAIEAYARYKTMLPARDNLTQQYVDTEIEACKSAKEAIKHPVNVEKINLGEPVNSASSNFKAVLSGNGKSLLYMDELPFYNAVYYCRFENGNWTEPVNITPQIQSDGDQYVTAVSYNGDMLYLTREDAFNSDIWVSHLKDGIWSKSQPVQGEVNTRFWESHAGISSDGKVMYYACNQTGGQGGMDIYKSVLGADKKWGPPANLGPVINTPVNEDTPFITEDGKTLYFSSQGHGGIGGYDFYKSTLNGDNQWTAPVNLGYPISTTDDDLFYYPWMNGRYALVSLYESNGLGKEDIYEMHEVKPGESTMTLAEKLTADEKIEKEKAELVEMEEKEITEEKAEIEVPDTVSDHLMTEETTEEKVKAEKIEEVIAEFPAPEEVQVKTVELSPVYFGFDSYTLTPEGKSVLGEMAGLLEENPGFSLQLKGYTDAIGSAAYNKILSERRAGSALNYLTSKGINPERMSIAGLGESGFAAINRNSDGTDSPEGRKLNRRVEFELSGTGKENLEIIQPEIPENLKIK